MNANSETQAPAHVSIIMDGNGRWATQRGLSRSAGHLQGAETLRTVLTEASHMGIRYLSVYAFSEENWNRSKDEVDALMQLLDMFMHKEIDNMVRENVRLRVLGNRARLSDGLNATIDRCMERTAENTGITFIIFLSYSGRWDMLQAAKRFAQDAAKNPELISDATLDCLGGYFVTAGIPDPDLIIRTSGELRISNYLLWQAAYSEFYFTDVLWPDFGREELVKALEAFTKRDRRYGKTK